MDSESTIAVCWACQSVTDRHDRIIIDGNSIPICLTCWQSIPTAHRINIAQKIQAGVAVRQVLDQLSEIFRQHAEGEIDLDPPWMRN